MADLKLKLILEAVDRVTRPIQRVSRAIQSINAPAQKMLQRLGGTVVSTAKLIGRTLGLSFGTLITATGLMIRRLSDLGGQAMSTAKRIGAAVMGVQRLNYAAAQNESNAAEMADGLKFLNRNAVAAASGSQEMAVWFRRAGISVKDAHGKIKPTEQLVGELADKFHTMPDGPKKTALAMALLGRSGEGLIPTLNLGRKGLDEMGKKAEWLGIVMDKETAESFDDLGDNMADVGRAGQGIFIAALKPLLPLLNGLVTSVTKWLVANRTLIAGKLTEFVKGLSEVLPQVWDGIKVVAQGLWWFAGVVNRIVQIFGGWKVVIVAVAAVIAGQLVAALGALTAVAINFGIALLATPIGIFLAGIAAIGAAAYLLIKHWTKVKEFFVGLIETVFSPLIVLMEKISSLVPKSLAGTAFGRAGQGAVSWRDQPAQSPFGRSATAAMQQVGGTIKIVFDDKGRPRVQEARPDSGGVDFEVETGAVIP